MRIIGTEPGPDKKDIIAVYKQVKLMADQSYEFAKKGDRAKLKEEIAKTEIEMKIKATAQYEEAKNMLQRTQFQQALTVLEKVAHLDPNVERIKLYICWAKLGLYEAAANKGAILKDLEAELMQIPPEEKFDALYNFVMGLFSRAKGDPMASKKYLEKAINLDANFIVARRELARTSQMTSTTQKKDVLNRDLKDLVSGFFKKK